MEEVAAGVEQFNVPIGRSSLDDRLGNQAKACRWDLQLQLDPLLFNDEGIGTSPIGIVWWRIFFHKKEAPQVGAP